MLLQGKAAEAANDVLRAFQNPKTLPDPWPTMYVCRNATVPCSGWSCQMSGRAVNRWLRQLPLRIVADLWGISVKASYTGVSNGRLGYCRLSPERSSITIGVLNLNAWAHELVHAADHRNGTWREATDHWRMETVAEFGGAILLKTLGYDQDADLGGCWQYIRHYVRPKKIGVVKACNLVLERTCDAVTLILDAHDAFRKEIMQENVA